VDNNDEAKTGQKPKLIETLHCAVVNRNAPLTAQACRLLETTALKPLHASQ